MRVGIYVKHPTAGLLESTYYGMTHCQLLTNAGVTNWTHFDKWERGYWAELNGKREYFQSYDQLVYWSNSQLSA